MAKRKPSRPVFGGDLTAGSTFFFGRYPQKTDLAEPIEWHVLSAEEGIAKSSKMSKSRNA